MTVFITFLQSSIRLGTTLLLGSTGEIITEKSGNLNLGIPGIMYMGGIGGIIGGFFYQNAIGWTKRPNEVLAILLPLLVAILFSLAASLIYCFLTVTLRANQNVAGLALTTFGVGFGNFFGGSLAKLVDTDMPYVALTRISKVWRTPLPFADKLGWFGDIFLSHGFMVYLAIVIAVVATVVLCKTRVGLNLRAVGENPATADAAGINVTVYKYVATCAGGVIAGLGGLYYIISYLNGIWSNGGFGDFGWLAIALVIFSVWRPDVAIFGSYLFGALYLVYNIIIGLPLAAQPLLQMLPYLVTILVLIFTSIRKKRETQPPASLGLSYFREER